MEGLDAGWSVVSGKMKHLLASEGPHPGGTEVCASLSRADHRDWGYFTFCNKFFSNKNGLLSFFSVPFS